jgi:hypothetical protein
MLVRKERKITSWGFMADNQENRSAENQSGITERKLIIMISIEGPLS